MPTTNLSLPLLTVDQPPYKPPANALNMDCDFGSRVRIIVRYTASLIPKEHLSPSCARTCDAVTSGGTETPAKREEFVQHFEPIVAEKELPFRLERGDAEDAAPNRETGGVPRLPT
jgi:hypothetical protein